MNVLFKKCVLKLRHMLVILALGRLRRENCDFEDSLDYLARPCLKKKKTTKTCVLKKQRSPTVPCQSPEMV
jgi:hypothetical protein